MFKTKLKKFVRFAKKKRINIRNFSRKNAKKNAKIKIKLTKNYIFIDVSILLKRKMSQKTISQNIITNKRERKNSQN